MSGNSVDDKRFADVPESPVPADFLDSAETLGGALSELVERYAAFDCLTLVDRTRCEERASFERLFERAAHIQAELSARGLEPGQCVLLALPTGPELVSAYFGAMLAGGVPALVATPSNRVADPRLYARRVATLVESAAVRLVYCSPDVAALFDGADRELLGSAALLTPGEVSARRQPARVVPAQPDDVATLQFSSGSTGVPKGILLTHRAMLNNIRYVRDGLCLTPADVSVNWIPLYHDMGLIDAFLLPLLSGSHVVLIPTMDFLRDPALWPWAVHRYRGALSWAPNFAYAICARRVEAHEVEGLDLSSWRVAINAAEPVLASTIDDFCTRYAAHGFAREAMTPAWGLAENVTIATAHPVDEAPRIERIDRARLATDARAEPVAEGGISSVAIGVCLPHCHVEIRDAEGRALDDRGVGRVWLRTNSLFTGYRGDPEQTAKSLVDGWLDTGDQGYLVDGHLFFVSRDKDLILIGGENYAPHDVETFVNTVPGVREGCAVALGVTSEERGTEELAIVVETREESEEARAELGRAIRQAVTRGTGLGVRHLLLVPPGGIEKTTSGKLARRSTFQRYADRLGRDGVS